MTSGGSCRRQRLGNHNRPIESNRPNEMPETEIEPSADRSSHSPCIEGRLHWHAQPRQPEHIATSFFEFHAASVAAHRRRPFLRFSLLGPIRPHCGRFYGSPTNPGARARSTSAPQTHTSFFGCISPPRERGRGISPTPQLPPVSELRPCFSRSSPPFFVSE